MTEQVVGIIGGMGPEATVDLMRRIIAATPAQDDADHIHMLVDNNPKVPSRIKALIEGGGENPGPTLARMAQGLETAGADFLVIPCNTAHHYWSYAAEAVTIPVWNIVELTLASIAAASGPASRGPATRGPASRVGVLASPAVRDIRLYERHADAYAMDFLYPRRPQQLLDVIKAVKAKRLDEEGIAAFNEAAQELRDAGADALVLACTEFSVIADRLDQDIPVFDSLQVLAEGIVAQVKGLKKPEGLQTA